VGEKNVEMAGFLVEGDAADVRPSASDPSPVPSLDSFAASLTLALGPTLLVLSSTPVSESLQRFFRPVHLQAAAFPFPQPPFAQSVIASAVLALWSFQHLQSPRPPQRLFVPVPSVSFVPPIVASAERTLAFPLEGTKAS